MYSPWPLCASNHVCTIDREFPAVKITDCLKTGVNAAGNPEQYPLLITTLNTLRL